MPERSSRVQLSPSERETFFVPHGHLNYRYTMLWRHQRANNMEYGDAICALESSLVACRVFMEFLGLGITYVATGPELIEKRDYFRAYGLPINEVKVVDLGGTFVELVGLSNTERELLATVYHVAVESTTHFTVGTSGLQDGNIIQPCAEVIDRLLYENLYNIVGEKPLEHD